MTPTREESMQMAMKHCVLDCYEGDLTCIESLVAAAYALGAAQAQQNTEPELPEPHLRIPRNSMGAKWIDDCFSATQMHDHYQAGVRVGMGQSLDAKLNYAPLYDYAQANRTDYNQLCTAVRAAMQGGQQWQPIDSAPKDGTVVLGYRDGRIGTASRVQRSDCEMWTFCGTSADAENHPKVKPTHWMPLPAAPAMQGGQQ